MSPAARTVQLFGISLVGVGTILIVVPNVLLGVLSIPSTDQPWIRILGLVVLVLAGCGVRSGRHRRCAVDAGHPPGQRA